MPKHCSENAKWKRRSDGRRFPVRYLCKPRSVDEISEMVRFAEKNDYRVRAVGFGHSYSNVATTTGVCIDLSKMNKDIRIDEPPHTDSDYPHPIAHCPAGISIRDLNMKLSEDGLALENMGSYDGQWIAGAIATGTHGSGIKFGPLADQVLSLDIVIAGGTPVHLDREKDADQFNAVVVSMGCTGVIYKMALRVIPAYDLLEHRRVCTWKSICDKLEQGDFLDKFRHVEVWVNPYKDPKSDRHTCLLMTRHEPTKEERPSRYNKRPRKQYLTRGAFSHYLAWLGGFIGHLLGKGFEDPTKASSYIKRTLNCLAHEGYFNRSDKVLLLGTENAAVKASLGIEFSVPRIRCVKAVEMLFELAERRTSQKRTFLSSFIAIRFVKKANAYLAMQQGVETATLEMGVLKSVTGAGVVLDDCSRELLKLCDNQHGGLDRDGLGDDHVPKLYPKVGGRPHWGLNRDGLTGVDVQRLYPETFDKWKKVYSDCNRNGTFNNEFTDRLGISIDPRNCD